MSPTRSLTLAALLSLPPVVPAQDMFAVDWDGSLYALDSMTGVAEWIGTGTFGQNCLARDGNGVLWTCTQSPVSPTHYLLTRIDPVLHASTPLFQTGDMRALAVAANGDLFAVLFNGGANQLVRIQTATGTHTSIGLTGTGLLQGMTRHNGVLYAWDLNRGLGQIDETTGIFTDVGFGTGGNIQWLATRRDGQLIGGGLGLYAIDTTTGVATFYAASPYVRGAESAQFATAFGSGCQGGSGIVTLSVSGSLRPGTLVTTTSTGHTATGAVFSGIGIVAIGFSRTAYLGGPLPVLLDPVLGTQGCYLLTSADVLLSGNIIASPSAVYLQRVFALPPTLQDYTFFVQHFGFDNVPGGLSASNALLLHVAD